MTRGTCTRCQEEHEILSTIYGKNHTSQFCKPCAKQMGFKK